MTSAPLPARRRARALGAAALGLLAFAALAAFVLADGRTGPTGVDAAWADAMRGIRSAPLTAVGLALNVVGGTIVSGIAVPVVVAVALIARGRSRQAYVFLAATVVSAAAVKAAKFLVDRPRPEDMMVASDVGSFPSGHSANAALLVTVLAAMFAGRRWIAGVGALYVVAMMLSRTYLSAHWLTDTGAGTALGFSVGLLVWAAARPLLDSPDPPARDG